jgi:glycosyltransferase involved in cell wall biosynthesis
MQGRPVFRSTMRFAFFTGHYFPHLGGVERYAKELASRVAARGHECWIVTNRTNRAPAEEEADGIRIFRLPAWNLFSGRFPVTLPAPKLVRCIRAIHRWGPDWVVTNTRFFPVNLIATFANKVFFRARHMHIEHGSGFIEFGSPVLTGISKIYDAIALRTVIRRATVCVGVSRSVNDFVARTSSRRCDAVLHNAVDAEAVELCGPSFHEELGIGRGEIVFGFAGRLVPEKGVLQVLTAFQAMKRNASPERTPVHLLFAGTGPLEDLVARMAREDPTIHYLGVLKETAMGAFYRTIDIFVYPTSCPEGFPTVILESGAYQKLVITTERGSARDAIPDASFGMIVPEHDTEALERAMSDYAFRCRELRFVGENLRNHVCAHFNWEHTVRNFLDLVGCQSLGRKMIRE